MSRRLYCPRPRGRVVSLALALAIALLSGCGQSLTSGTQPATSGTQPAITGTQPATSGTQPAITGTATSSCNRTSQWKVAANNVSLDDLAMVAPNEGWAVGALGAQWPSSSASPSGVIYHLTNGVWQRLPQLYPGAELSTISMGAPDDGWAASDNAVTGDEVLVLHYSQGRYSQGRWMPVDVPALDAVLKGPPGSFGGAIDRISIQMFGPNAGWMFAWAEPAGGPNNSASRAPVVVLRYAQGVWSPIAAPTVTPTTTLFSLSAVSADEAWIVGTEYGTDNPTALFAHFHNGGWSLWPKTFPGVTENFTMLSPTDGWAFDSGPQAGNDSLLHYDGTSWAPVATPDWANQQIVLTSRVFPASPGVTWFGAAHAEGFGAGTALIERYAAGRWQQVAWPFGDVQPLRLAAGTSGEQWGIGNINHQEGCPPALVTDIAQAVFLHYRQGSWGREVLA